MVLLDMSMFASPACAANIRSASDLVSEAKSADLAHHPYWISLLHYQLDKRFPESRFRSEINSPDFFNSPDGATDPFAELVATLQAFFAEPGENPDEHAQCRFVARYHWLRKKLDWQHLKPPSVTCKRYNEWSMYGKVDSLSLIFATGYLSNPASFYGHILLKFNSGIPETSNDFLDQSINFGAIVPEHESGVVYAVKGLFGGYDASFSNARFYKINHIYAESELRDLWEYRLNLDEDQIDQIVAHSWELLGKTFKYYFAKENCAYRMGELLELAIGDRILPGDLPWAMPGTIFNRIESMQMNGGPLVKDVRLIPSRLNSYHARYRLLSESQKSLIKKLAVQEIRFDDPAYTSLNESAKIAIADTLLDYFEFRLASGKNSDNLKNMKRMVLVERINLPSQAPHSGEQALKFPDSSPPHKAPLPGMIRTGALNNSRLGTGAYFQLRPAYFDVLDPNDGRMPDSRLTMFELGAAYLDGGLRLRELDLIHLENMNVGRTPLPGDGGYAWELLAGLRSRDASCINCIVFNTTGGIGKAYEINSGLLAYGMVDMFVQSGDHGPPPFGTEPRVGLIATPHRFWKLQIYAGQYWHFNSNSLNRKHLRWENKFSGGRNWDVRVNLEQDVTRELQVGISTYW
jgi:hypothetical protein